MQNVYPNYYPAFHCIAGCCKHSCCIGWEIDVDKDTRKKYRSVRGELGKRLKSAVTRGKNAHFILQDGERCPFLNSDNLCELILHGSDDMLCQICRDHPRFRSFFPGRTEIGLGLCCEAAAALILSQTEKITLTVTGESEADNDAETLLRFRESLFSIVQDRTKPVSMREAELLSYCGTSLPDYSPAHLAALFLSLERMDEKWTELLNMLREFSSETDAAAFSEHMRPRETEYENLLFSFLYRHIPAERSGYSVVGIVKFCVLSLRLLRLLGALQYARSGTFSAEDQIELVRMYSAEIEYSDQNLDILFSSLS